jgi:hypothetical protein
MTDIPTVGRTGVPKVYAGPKSELKFILARNREGSCGCGRAAATIAAAPATARVCHVRDSFGPLGEYLALAEVEKDWSTGAEVNLVLIRGKSNSRAIFWGRKPNDQSTMCRTVR